MAREAVAACTSLRTERFPTDGASPAWNLLPPHAREVFREALGVDDATWTRGRGRTLSQAPIALPHYRTTNPAMAHNARRVIRAVLEED